ncbi:MAG: hypothetical protein WD598_17890 [Acidimicrobiia bacterium]
MRIAVWVAFPLAGMLWIATWYQDHWYYYDEWTMIDKSLGSWTEMFSGHQGHLEVPSYILYRLQRAWFGLEGHQLIWVAFMASVAAMQIGIALVLRRLGVPTLLALLAALVVTYFGPGGQNVVWEFQLGINFCLAACFFAAYVVLGDQRTPKSATLIAALLVLAIAADSGVAIIGGVFVTVLLAFLWPMRFVVASLWAPALVGLGWLMFGDQGVQVSASFDTMFKFATRLFLVSAGGLIGGGETRSVVELTPANPTIPLDRTWVGAIALATATGCVLFGALRHRLDRRTIIGLGAGLAAAAFGTAALARGRSFLIAPSQLPGSRYVQWIAMFLLLAFAPAIVASLRSPREQLNRVAGAAAVAGLVGVFVLNLGQFNPVRQFSEDWAAQVKASVQQVVTVLDDGCGSGRRVAGNAMPSPDLAPQINVALLQDLMADGALPRRFGIPAPKEMLGIVCRPARAGADRDEATP